MAFLLKLSSPRLLEAKTSACIYYFVYTQICKCEYHSRHWILSILYSILLLGVKNQQLILNMLYISVRVVFHELES